MTECDEVAANLAAPPHASSFDDCLASARAQMGDQGETIISNIAEVLYERCRRLPCKYIVIDEQVLGYYQPGTYLIGVLQRKPSAFHKSDNVTVVMREPVRPATAEDFDSFRVTKPSDL